MRILKKHLKKKGLLKVRKEENDSAIIFVHGLQGDPYKTWTKKGCNSLPEMFTEDEKYNDFDVYTFGYNTGFIFKRHEFKDIADLLYTEIEAKLSNYIALSFITHSMGGIVVQSMLREQVERKNKKFLETVNGIVYLAVPFLGSTIALTASSIPYMLLPPIIGERVVSIQVQSLKVFSKELADLSVKWDQYRGEELSNLKELNLYGQSDKTVAVSSARAPHIKNSRAVEEGHISICKIEKDSTVYKLITKFHNDLGSEKKAISVTEPELEKYLNWIKLCSENFFVPGVNVPLSIEHAWASLHVIDEPSDELSESLEKEIAKYHEWERLTTRLDVKKSAQEISELGRKIVVIGGPGSGKSTLARRTVYRLAIKGEKVLYIRLPNVAKEMEQGKSFEDALWSVALDGYPGNKALLKLDMANIDTLVADGLDECEPFRKRVSQSLHDWLIGRTDTRMVVTTRPVGYNPAQFNSFHHVEILPLAKKEIEKYSLKLLQTLIEDKKKALEMHNRFQQQLETNKMVNIASRSPLLLNFLIQLLVSGKPFGNYRTDLYSKIINEWMRQSDRGKEQQIDEQIAIRSIEWIGWILQNVLEGNGGRTEHDVLQKLSFFIEDELSFKPLQAKRLANECLQFWVQIGVLEHLKVGFEGGYTFIHLTLGEYAAGKYISSLQEEEQQEILLEKMHVAIWRETLLLASGTGCTSLFVETILENIDGKLDLYNDIAFAAAMLVEAPPIPELSKKVTKEALDSLTSSFPLLCYEAGEALEGIAQQEPDWMFSLVEPLLQHEQNWTKLVSYKLALMTRRVNVNLTTIQALIAIKPKESINFPNFKISSGWAVWNSALELSMDHVLKSNILNEQDVIEIMETLSETSLSASIHINISKTLQEIGKPNLLKILERNFKNKISEFNFLKDSLDFFKGERALLNAVLRQIPIKHKKIFNKENSLFEISKLYQAIQLGEKPAFDLNALAEGIQPTVIDEVVKGILIVYEFEQEDLYNEIHWVLSDGKNDKLLYSSLPDVLKPEPNWEKANSLLNKDLLIQSLSYPSQTVAGNGAMLLVNCFDNNEIMEQYINAFMEAKGESLFYFIITAEYILEENALDTILERLKGKQTKGIHYLYDRISDFPQAKNNKFVDNALLKGVKIVEPTLVKSAATSMLKLGSIYDEKEIFKIASYWDRFGVLCDRHGIRVVGSCCPECNIVPDSPLPELIRLLKKSELFTLEDRIYFSKHPRSDVGKAGLETLAYYLSVHIEEMNKLIQEIKMGNESVRLLDAIFNIDAYILKSISEELLSLIESEKYEVRKKLLEELTKGQWIDSTQSIPIIIKALKDENSVVCNQAVMTYRSLGLSEEISRK
ncbi:NACHT domain-containing protein [Bacillus inaquosorum]|uniref:alpha/beta hydrolase n=1 Tax=Bacillus inaquosorum TaxID=483913 RepID=UPI002E1CDF85|nr:NACHT domain-containing protein [Bacillus inaquosorum]